MSLRNAARSIIQSSRAPIFRSTLVNTSVRAFASPPATTSKPFDPIIRVLSREIKAEEKNIIDETAFSESLRKVKKNFTIEENFGRKTVKMFRTLIDGSKMEVKFDIDFDHSNDGMDEGMEDDEEGESKEEKIAKKREAEEMVNEFRNENPMAVYFVVKVTRGNHSVEGTFVSTPLTLVHMSVSQSDSVPEDSYSPNFDNLSEKMYSRLSGYFENIGINKDFASFVVDYAKSKETKEYYNWLRSLSTFFSN